MGLLIDYKIPLWGIVSTFVIVIIPVAWGLINNHFSLKANTKEISDLKVSHDTQIKQITDEMYHHEKAIDNLRKDIELKLDEHKHATDQKLSSINDIMIETKTLVRLLVDDRLK